MKHLNEYLFETLNDKNVLIQNWINKDVKKRNVAWDNKLNYLEIFSKKGKEAIEAFEKYLEGNEPYAVFIYDK